MHLFIFLVDLLVYGMAVITIPSVCEAIHYLGDKLPTSCFVHYEPMDPIPSVRELEYLRVLMCVALFVSIIGFISLFLPTHNKYARIIDLLCRSCSKIALLLLSLSYFTIDLEHIFSVLQCDHGILSIASSIKQVILLNVVLGLVITGIKIQFYSWTFEIEIDKALKQAMNAQINIP